MIIPDDEKDSWTFNLSKAALKWTGFLIASLCIGSLLILVLYFPKLSYYGDIETNYNKLISERLEVLELSQDLKKIKQIHLKISTRYFLLYCPNFVKNIA